MSNRSDVSAVVKRHISGLSKAELAYLRRQTSYANSIEKAYVQGATETPRASSTTIRVLRAWRTKVRAAQADVEKLKDSKARTLAVKTYKELDGAITALLPTLVPGASTERQLQDSRQRFSRYRTRLKKMNGYLF